MSSNLAEGKFSIEDYDKQKCFSSFLPGIAGIKGVPMWVFYVNRGQAIASFGIENKNKAIMEFRPADQSYAATDLKGFRTFLRINEEYYEAFSAANIDKNIEREMLIDKNILVIKEVNESFGIETKVTYYTLPEEEFSALVRVVEIKNIGNRELNIELVDGLPEVLPFGISNNLYKDMGFTARAWMETTNVENNIPLFGVRTSVGDTEIVEELKSAYFYFASNGKNLLKNVYDKNALFGTDASLQRARIFETSGIEGVNEITQYTENILPCAFGIDKKNLKTGEIFRINSMIGFSEKQEYISENIDRLMTNEYIDEKKLVAEKIVNDLTKGIKTKTSSEAFDSYCEQNYLDNMLRGGYPLIFENKNKQIVYHIFSRKHGDLERDYNFFSLQANKYSQGNGNFRDVLQNRRNDVFFNPEVGEFNIKMFMNFIQADGNNPLVIKGTTFKLESDFDEVLKYAENKKAILEEYLLKKEFTPGEVLSFINKNEITLNISEEEFIKTLLYYSNQYEQAEFGEGYWIDHWTYLMDLIDSYKEIYPENMEKLLFEEKTYKTFDSPAFVKARKDKYKLHNGKVMQIGALEESEEKEHLIKKRGHNYLVDVNQEIYKSNLFEKLFLLGVMKFTGLDPLGMGIEMEANKPGWNDALNGLPGIFGSGMSETFELKRVVKFLKNSLIDSSITELFLFSELGTFIKQLEEILDDYFQHDDQFIYWNKVATLKEEYRLKVFMNISGNQDSFTKNDMLHLINKMISKLDKGIEKSKEFGKGIYPTYFSYELVEYDTIDGAIKAKKFGAKSLPLFLEGPTRAFKTLSLEERKETYSFIKNSNIYDKQLKMYKTSESIMSEAHDIGRLRAFTPGWLENESVFMHMEFKYLLELLKGDLYDEYFEDIKTSFPPFLNYEKYGRSIIENSSFIASSANKNINLQGQGFSARLSGSTAEFLSMWKYMFIGKNLFTYENNELSFEFNPIISGDFFDENAEVNFLLFSEIDVKYINKSKKSTFGNDGSKIAKIEFIYDNRKIEVLGNKLKGVYAENLRNKKLKNIVCTLIRRVK